MKQKIYLRLSMQLIKHGLSIFRAKESTTLVPNLPIPTTNFMDQVRDQLESRATARFLSLPQFTPRFGRRQAGRDTYKQNI